MSRQATVRELRPCPAVPMKSIQQLNTATWRTFRPVVDNARCTRCQLCVIFCPDGVVKMIEEGIEINYDYCKGCGICAQECRPRAITMIRED